MRAAITEIIRFLLIYLFGYTALAKLLEYNKLVNQLSDSPLLPAFMSQVAWVIPLVEIVVVIFLIAPSLTKIGFYLSAVLMLAFTLYVLSILTIAEYVPCSCGGVIELLSWRGHLVLNIGFLLLSVLAIVLQGKVSVGVRSIH